MNLEQPLPFGKASDLDIVFNWTPWLLEVGDQITSFNLTHSAGLQLHTQSQSAGVVTTWVRQAPAANLRKGAILKVWCRITTNSSPPRVDTREYTLVIS